MSTTGIVLVIVLALVVIGLVVAAPIVLLRRKSAASRAQLEADLALDPAVLGPERGTYRGSTGAYSKVAGTGLIALTRRNLFFSKMTGGRVDVPVADISGAHISKTFNRGRVGGASFLVVRTRSGELGYLVTDPDAWLAALADVVPRLDTKGS